MSFRIRLLQARRIFARHPIRSYSSPTNTHPPTIRLRPYQEACLEACLTDLSKHDVSRIGVSLPTGAGKTTVFVSLISKMVPPLENPRATKALIIVNSIELARQAANQVRVICPELKVEIDQGQKHKASGMADVTVATYQTLKREGRLAMYDPSQLKVIIVDEAHHAAARSYRHILSYFHPDIQSPDVDAQPPKLAHTIPIVGFSATFSRHDGLALGSVFQRISYHQDFLLMMKENWLCDIRFTTVRADLDLSNVKISSRTGEFRATSLAHVVNTDTVNELVVRTWFHRASQRKSTLIFCVNLKHLHDLTKKFRDAGVDARYVYSETPSLERKALITEFRECSFPILLNVAILTEGADIPNIDCVIIAKPTRSQNLFSQMIGRGMRLSPDSGKTDCHLIDIVDSKSRVDGVVSTPTLFGLDPNVVIDDAPLVDLERRANATKQPDLAHESHIDSISDPTHITYIDYDDPFALVHGASGAPHVYKSSPFEWVGCGGDIYVLECLGKGYVRIEPNEVSDSPCFIGTFVEAMPKWGSTVTSPYRKPRQILTALTVDDAIRGCDKYVQAKIFSGRVPVGLFRSAPWRKVQATDAQKDFLVGKVGSKKHGKERVADFTTLTKGQAANMITRLRHGAKARYEKKKREEDKRLRAIEEERRRIERTVVTVGPLKSKA